MADERSLRQARVFERFWDALVSGRTARPTDELDPDVVAVARRLQALNRPAPTDADFEARLWEDLMHAHSLGASIPLRPTLLPHGNGRALPRHPAIQPRPARPQRRVAVGLSWFATVALVVVVLAMIFFVFRNGQPAVVPPAQETPTAVPTPTAPQPSGWLQFRGNAARTGNMPGPGPVGQPVLLWKAHPTGGAGHDEISDPPAIADGVMYVGTGRGLLALDVKDGSELWRAVGYGGGPAVDGDGLIARTETGQADGVDLVRLRRSDGSVVWTAEVGQQRVTWFPAIEDGVIYIPSGPSDLIALDPATGAVKWRTKLDAPASRGAAIANGAAYVGDEAGKLYAVETGSGDVLWTHQTDGTTLGVPSVANGMVYLSTKDGPTNTYYALDAATGDLKWTFAAPGGGGFYYAAVDASTVYVPCTDGSVYALDAVTGALRWKFQTNGELIAMPVIVGDTLYQAGTDGFAYAVDAATGQERWRFAIDGQSMFSPVVLDGVVYVTTGPGSIYAIGGSESAPVAVATAQASPSAAANSPNSSPSASTADPIAFVWATAGDTQHKLSRPGTVAIDPAGRLWVTSMPGDFFIFDLDGNLLETWGTPGPGDGQFDFTDPQDGDAGAVLFAPDGSFFVADTFNARIQEFDKDRNFVRSWGTRGTGDGQFLAPVGMAFDAQGNLLISDVLRNNVQRFSPDGAFLGVFGGPGNGPGEFKSPLMITIAADGAVWIADGGNNRVQVFNPDGSFKFAIGQAGQDGSVNLNFPSQVAFDRDGNAFVTDQNNNLVRVFDSQGRFIYQFGGIGNGDGQFNAAGSIAIYRGTTVFVVDWHGNRLEKFKVVGPFPPPAAETPAA